MSQEGDQTQIMASENQGPPPEAAPRENMIATAINFLQNPKVRESPFPQRRTFLEKKGLTAEEIELAIQRSGTAGDEQHQVAVQPPQGVYPPTGPLLPQLPPQPVSMWSRVRDYMATAIVIGGVSYALYMFYKRYIRPIWFGPSPEEQQLSAIQKSVEDLRTNLAETLDSIKELQQIINKQQENIEDVVKTNAAQRGSSEMYKMQESQQTSEIKEEIKSLKGLLLNRKQFPATPKTGPIIPSWQLEASKSQSSPDSEPQSLDSNTVNSTAENSTGTTELSEVVSAPAQTAPINDPTESEQNEVKEENPITMNGLPEGNEDSVSADVTKSTEE